MTTMESTFVFSVLAFIFAQLIFFTDADIWVKIIDAFLAFGCFYSSVVKKRKN